MAQGLVISKLGDMDLDNITIIWQVVRMICGTINDPYVDTALVPRQKITNSEINVPAILQLNFSLVVRAEHSITIL